MLKGAADKSSVEMAARFAYAAGITGVLANLFLLVMYVLLGLRTGHSESQTLLGSAFHVAGSASDLAGSLATAFMIPVALTLSRYLPQRRSASFTQAAGLTAMALLSLGGPLLVLGVLAFEVETPIMVAAWMVLCVWLLLVNRWLRLSHVLSVRLAWFGEYLGAGVLAAYVVVGLGLLLPWMSWPQLAVFGFGGFIGLPAWLGIPVWFLLLGRHFETL